MVLVAFEYKLFMQTLKLNNLNTKTTNKWTMLSYRLCNSNLEARLQWPRVLMQSVCSSYLKPCSHSHLIYNIASMMHCWRATLEARRIKKKKTNQRRRKYKKYFTLKICCKKSKVQPRSKNDMHFACCIQSFDGNTFALCTPQSVKH